MASEFNLIKHLAQKDSPEIRGDLLSIALDHAFVDDRPFDHMFMTAGETLTRVLEDLGVAEVNGQEVRLICSKPEVIARVSKENAADAIPLIDLLGAILCYANQYLTVPLLHDPQGQAVFEAPLAAVLKRLGLIGSDGIAVELFWPVLIDHYHLVEGQYSVPPRQRWEARLFERDLPAPKQGWHHLVRQLLDDLATATFEAAPTSIRSAFSGLSSERPRGVPQEFYLRWRYGSYLREGREPYYGRHSGPLLDEVLRRCAALAQ